MAIAPPPLDRKPTSLGRDTGWQLKIGGTIEHEVTYGYHTTTGRLETVANAADTFTYGYTPNSSHIATVTGPAHTVTNTWETTRDVLKTKLNKETVGTASYPSSFGYTVNALGQRETVGPVLDENDAPVSTYSVSWGWDYNDRGELQSADHGDDATPNTHDRFYAFDAIGNRDYVRTGVYADSGGTQLDYIANDLNQFTVANGVSLPTTPTPAPHDLDGNLRFDGGVNKDNEAREYLWDAENRLTAVKRVSDSATVVSFLYDAQSRRIAKMAGTTATLYIYDSFNCIAEYSWSSDLQSASLSKTRTWGIDLSGTLQGAGGVGGLLAETQGTSTFYPTFDGNGNISEYLAADGSTAAHFEYDPFGNTVVNTDSSGQFSYRFSTKPLDSETGLYYYQYRYYDPLTGRWPSRDPIEEEGGMNLYGFVFNNSISRNDYLGLCSEGESRIDEAKVISTSATDSEEPDGKAESAARKFLTWLFKKVAGAGDRARPRVPNQLDAAWGWKATVKYSCCECVDKEMIWVSKDELKSHGEPFASQKDADLDGEQGLSDLKEQVSCN